MQTVQTETRPPQIIPALDGIRGIAILLVMGLHYTIRYSTLTSPLARAIRTPLQLGWCGVDVFFVLSGFLITGILLRERGQEGYYRNFYMRRVLRIFPLYYFVLFVVFAIGPLVPAVDDADFQRVRGLQGWLWSYLTNVAIARDLQWDFNTEYVRLGHLWSLAIEEHFYFVWPWLVAVLPPRSLLRAGVAIIVATTLLRIGMAALHVNPLAGYVLTPTRADALVLGGCVAILVRDPASLARLRRFAVPALVVGPLLVLGVVPITHSTQTTYWPMQIIGFPAIAAAPAGLIVIGYTAQAGGVAHTALSGDRRDGDARRRGRRVAGAARVAPVDRRRGVGPLSRARPRVRRPAGPGRAGRVPRSWAARCSRRRCASSSSWWRGRRSCGGRPTDAPVTWSSSPRWAASRCA